MYNLSALTRFGEKLLQPTRLHYILIGNNKNKIDSVEKIFDNIIFISNEKNNEEKQIIYE